jgi:hypothetical protein
MMQNKNKVTPNNKKKTYLVFFLLILFTAMPMVLGGFLFHYPNLFKFKTLNHGILINSPIPVQKLKFVTADKKKWQLIYIPTGCCDSQCEKKLYVLHQMQKALSMDGERLSLVFTSGQTCQQDFLNKLSQQYNFQNYVLSNQDYKKLSTDFSHHGQKDFVITNKIYLVDPRGNLFMYYTKNAAVMGILKDLKILLQTSKMG